MPNLKGSEWTEGRKYNRKKTYVKPVANEIESFLKYVGIDYLMKYNRCVFSYFQLMPLQCHKGLLKGYSSWILSS